MPADDPPGDDRPNTRPGDRSGRHRSVDRSVDAPSAASLYRPYMAVGGRTRPTGGIMDLTSLIVAKDTIGMRARARELGFDERAVLRHCQHFQQLGQSVSIVELGAAMGFPVPVVKVLVGDLQQKGFVVVSNPVYANGRPTADLMRRVLDGLRNLPTR